MKLVTFPKLLYIAGSQDFPDKASFFSHLEVLLSEGLSWFQFRDKALTENSLFSWALEIRELTSRYKAILTINDRPDIAYLVEADGVHMGQEDIPSMTSELIPLELKNLHIGISTHNSYEVKRSIILSPSYLGVGPINPTKTKTLEHAPRGIQGIIETKKMTTLPLVAIGGITHELAGEIFRAGAQTIAVSGALTKSPDPVKAMKDFLNHL
jgi:thiamine-phosphate pyrophosphorylase